MGDWCNPVWNFTADMRCQSIIDKRKPLGRCWFNNAGDAVTSRNREAGVSDYKSVSFCVVVTHHGYQRSEQYHKPFGLGLGEDIQLIFS